MDPAAFFRLHGDFDRRGCLGLYEGSRWCVPRVRLALFSFSCSARGGKAEGKQQRDEREERGGEAGADIRKCILRVFIVLMVVMLKGGE